jgi:hypothetical protein
MMGLGRTAAAMRLHPAGPVIETARAVRTSTTTAWP